MIACHHLCPYHAYHAACDHAYPVLRSVLCTPNPSAVTGIRSTEHRTQNRISMIASGMIGMIRTYSYLQDKHDLKSPANGSSGL